MHLGIAYTLKDASLAAASAGTDDRLEEFDSPETVEALARVFERLGHRVQKLGDGRPLVQRLLADPPDFVFNFAEGRGTSRSREAWAPALLEMLGIPYSGSDPLTLAVTLDKPVAKALVAAAGVATPAGWTLTDEPAADWLGQLSTRLPLIVKPAWEGSSKGIRARCLVKSAGELPVVIAELRNHYRQPILVEEFIAGDEVTVGVIGNAPPRVIGLLQVIPRVPTDSFVYSLEVKRDYERNVRYASPPELPAEVCERLAAAALSAYQALGCRDVARLDFRLRDGVPYFLEVNPLPGLHPVTSDLMILAKGYGWSYEDVIETVLAAALVRTGLKKA
jgi:D-alanine-D-alanine ligase